VAVVALRRSRTDRLSRGFARAVSGASPRVGHVPLLGVEHEFRVLAGVHPVDFRRVIHELPIAGRRIDPADPNAYRGSWGGVITADGPEAEIAVAPVPCGPGGPDALVRSAGDSRRRLEATLPEGLRLEGYSTHLSVSVADGVADRAARLYARTFAPALMLLMDGPESPGLLVRPRPGRLELGGEFVDGQRLRAAAVFAAASVEVVAKAVRRRPWPRGGLPPAIRVRLEPAIERFGWFIARDAFGTDLYAAGRATVLERTRGGRVSADEHLAACWRLARTAALRRFTPRDVAAVDRLAEGTEPLGVEGSQADAVRFADINDRDTGLADPLSAAFGAASTVHARPGFTVTPAVVSWEFAVLRIHDASRTAYACLPRRVLGAGLTAIGSGHLDALFLGYLEATARGEGRLLATSGQASEPGLFRGVGRAADLLASERSQIGGTGDRPGKRRSDDRGQQADPGQPVPPQPPAPPPGPAAGSAGAAAARSAAAGAAGAARGLPLATVGGAIVAITVIAVLVAAATGILSGPGSNATATSSAVTEPTPAPVSAAPTIGPSASPVAVVPAMTPDPSCLREPGVRSTKGDQAVTIQFVNHLSIPVETIWIGYDGERKLYQVVPAGSAYMQPTFITHPWIVADESGQCLLLVVTDASTQTVQVGP